VEKEKKAHGFPPFVGRLQSVGFQNSAEVRRTPHVANLPFQANFAGWHGHGSVPFRAIMQGGELSISLVHLGFDGGVCQILTLFDSSLEYILHF